MAEMTGMNRHPVDRLAEVRDRIKTLEQEADALRDRIIREQDFIGADYLATASETTRQTLDKAKLVATFGEIAVAACTKPSVAVMLRLRRRA